MINRHSEVETVVSNQDKVLTIPLVPLRNMTVFPHVTFSFEVARDKSRAAVRKAMETNNLVMLLPQRNLSANWPERDDLYDIGTIAAIDEVFEIPGRDMLRVRVLGDARAQIIELQHDAFSDRPTMLWWKF